MKITDYSVIQYEIEQQLLEQDFTIEEYLSETAIVIAVANIYTTGDLISGFSQDFKYDVNPIVPEQYKRLSIISTNVRICIILDGEMSYYKSDVPICCYENLTEDIGVILMDIQTVLDRILSR